jgi:hypothetical protein
VPPVALFLLAAVIGCYGTLIGAGGGFLLVPLLLLLYPSERVATLTGLSLAVVALNALSGTLAYARKYRIRYGLGVPLAAASALGSALGATMTRLVPRGFFDSGFGVILILLALFLFWRPLREVPLSPAVGLRGVASATSPDRVRVGTALSALIGWISGVMGIGGSPLQVVVLTHLMRVPVYTAMPTALFMVLFSSLSGVGAHLAFGHFAMDLPRLISLGAGTLIGSQVGAALSERIGSRGLFRLLALALLIVGLRLVWKGVV